MTGAFQGSLLDVGQPFGLDGLDRMRRTALAYGAWLDVLPGWVQGADEVFESLLRVVPWHADRRVMYDRLLDVPRLLCYYGAGQELPEPALARAMAELNTRYGAELGEPLCTAGLCLYRDGQDSVAWHGDTAGRQVAETIVAIVSFGTPRTLALRPAAGGGPTLRYPVGHGDLLVMGGTCQRTWQHAIPKSATAAGPRISVQFRARGIR